MFIVTGLAGVVTAGLWFLIYRDPRTQALGPQDKSYLRSCRASASAQAHVCEVRCDAPHTL